MWGRRRYTPAWATGHITESETHTLATYNGERARGIVHTPEWVQKMAELQRRFDEGQAKADAEDGITVLTFDEFLAHVQQDRA